MQDNQLISDLIKVEFHPDSLKNLQENSIETYSQLFDLLHDSSADIELRKTACHAVSKLYKSIDKQRVAPALLVALQSDRVELRRDAAKSLTFHSKRAKEPLIEIIQNKKEDQSVRIYSILALSYVEDLSIFSIFLKIINDVTDDLEVRCLALENSYMHADENSIKHYVELLSNESPNIRFWAVFALVNIAGHQHDISDALPKLDEIVANDHTLPERWGWHVDREAIEALESIYFRPYRQFFIDEDGEQDEHRWSVCLISPAHEYDRFMYFNRSYQAGFGYTIEPEPPITLKIDVDWLKNQIEEHWQDANFDVRRQSQAYTLSWLLQIDGYNLLGGLHRDDYAIVLTGHRTAVYEFAAWYRGIIKEHKLFLYGWADPGIHLKHDMTVEQIEKAIRKENKTFKQELKEAGK